jgi:hypothetical protein
MDAWLLVANAYSTNAVGALTQLLAAAAADDDW